MPVLTRSQAKMWNARNAKHAQRVYSDWEEVYNVVIGVDDLVGDRRVLEDFQTHSIPDGPRTLTFMTDYYQTYGGGPEGGYFVKWVNDGKGAVICGIYEVHRSWGEPFRVVNDLTRIGARFEFEREDYRAGQPARLRYSYNAPK